MRDEWYVARRGPDGAKRYGPVPLQQLRDLMDSGKVLGEDLVWREGMTDWERADQCADVAPRGYPPSGRLDDGYGQRLSPREYAAPYYEDAPYRRRYPRPSSSAWVIPLVIVVVVVMIGVLSFGGVLFFALMRSQAGVGSPSYNSSPVYETAPAEEDAPVIQDPPIWVPPPDPPIWVPPDPPSNVEPLIPPDPPPDKSDPP
jgi:anaerobic selenocysteine-containing dehydrogenase